MKCSWSDIDLGWRLGNVDSLCKEAIAIAVLLDTRCTFDFNGITVCVDKNSEWEKVAVAALKAVSDSDGSRYVSCILE